MLVLSRKLNEEIVIDGRIRIQVVQVKGKTVRLGISAPDDVKILRGELQPFEVESSVAGGAEMVRETCAPYLVAQAG